MSTRLHTLHCLFKCDYYIAGIPVSVVSGLAVLLLISVAINILAIIYHVYRLRGKLTQSHCVSRGYGDNVDQTYEQMQVDKKQHHTEAVAMKRNEAYTQLQISTSSPTTTTGL